MNLNTTVTAVAVYPDRARVTRTGAATLPPGSYRIEMPELPQALDPASVRATARGTARARLLGVDVRRDFYAQTPFERVRELEQQIEAKQDEVVKLDAQVELLTEERKAVRGLLEATATYARGLARGKTTTTDQMTLLDNLRQRAGDINATLLGLATQRRDLERQRQKLQQELDQLRGTRGRERYTAIVETEVTQAGDLTVELTYVIAQAGWTPLYDMRLLEDAKTVLEVGYLAQVTQQTGEDWTDVALTLSTARPALAGTLPELDPWYIAPIYAEPARRARGILPQAPMAATMDMMPQSAPGMQAKFAAEEEQSVEVAMATVESSSTAVTYRVAGQVSIPTDGTPHKVAVARFPLTPNVDYVSAPKLVSAAYRRAKVANTSAYTLLPGPANLFAGDEFIGATQLELTAAGGELELYLGVDDRVHIERELKRRDVDKKLIGNRRHLSYGYEIRLENLLSTEAKITLHDQMPVPRHEEIKVKLESAEPKPAGQVELGLLNWELTLAPGEKRTVRFDFSVDHPKEMAVTGLP